MEIRGSQYDWAYKTTMIKRDDYERIEKPNTRGKALGGSSSLSYFSWVPGSKGTFDLWGEYRGEEWTWDFLVPYLRQGVTYHDDKGLFCSELIANTNVCQTRYPIGQWIMIIISSSYQSMVQAVDIYKISNNKAI